MIGKTLSHYKIIAKLGQGGQGEVYLAEDSRLDRKVALKILPQHLSDRADLRERFEREARAVSSLNHPHICTLYDIGEQDGIHYLVMENHWWPKPMSLPDRAATNFPSPALAAE